VQSRAGKAATTCYRSPVAAIFHALHALQARPAILTAVVAVAFHGALVAALPHGRAGQAFDGAPPVEMDLPPSRPLAAPPAPPAPAQPGAVAAPATGDGLRAAGAALGVPRRDAERASAHAAPAPVPSAPLPLAPNSAPAPEFDLPAGPGGGADGPFGGPIGPASSGSPGSSGPPSVTASAAPAAPTVKAIDRSRPAAIVHGESWSWTCPWPAEADAIDDAVVVVKVTVDTAGRASRVEVMADPGYGFGREARRCALREAYTPALDREGRAVVETTQPIRVRFAR